MLGLSKIVMGVLDELRRGGGGGGDEREREGVNLCRGSRKISHYVGLVYILIIRLCLCTLFSFVT